MKLFKQFTLMLCISAVALAYIPAASSYSGIARENEAPTSFEMLTLIDSLTGECSKYSDVPIAECVKVIRQKKPSDTIILTIPYADKTQIQQDSTYCFEIKLGFEQRYLIVDRYHNMIAAERYWCYSVRKKQEPCP